MAEYSVGDKVTLKDDGQTYTVVSVRREDHVLVFDLEKGTDTLKTRKTVLRSQIEVEKVYAHKYPKVVIYKKDNNGS